MHNLSTASQNGLQIDIAEDLDVIMSMHNLCECRKNYKKT